MESKHEYIVVGKKRTARGLVYYLRSRGIRGAMMCNVWDKMEDARQLVRTSAQISPNDLCSAIR